MLVKSSRAGLRTGAILYAKLPAPSVVLATHLPVERSVPAAGGGTQGAGLCCCRAHSPPVRRLPLGSSQPDGMDLPGGHWSRAGDRGPAGGLRAPPAWRSPPPSSSTRSLWGSTPAPRRHPDSPGFSRRPASPGFSRRAASPSFSRRPSPPGFSRRAASPGSSRREPPDGADQDVSGRAQAHARRWHDAPQAGPGAEHHSGQPSGLGCSAPAGSTAGSPLLPLPPDDPEGPPPPHMGIPARADSGDVEMELTSDSEAQPAGGAPAAPGAAVQPQQHMAAGGLVQHAAPAHAWKGQLAKSGQALCELCSVREHADWPRGAMSCSRKNVQFCGHHTFLTRQAAARRRTARQDLLLIQCCVEVGSIKSMRLSCGLPYRSTAYQHYCLQPLPCCCGCVHAYLTCTNQMHAVPSAMPWYGAQIMSPWHGLLFSTARPAWMSSASTRICLPADSTTHLCGASCCPWGPVPTSARPSSSSCSPWLTGSAWG